MRFQRFPVDGIEMDIAFVKTEQIRAGVFCDIYSFVGTQDMDLAIVTVSAGHATPRQRVLGGMRTLEVYISGKGRLDLVEAGSARSYPVTDGHELQVEVVRGMEMQWHADNDLVFAEICVPPYEEGRFLDLT